MTLFAAVHESAIGTKRTKQPHQSLSAFGPKRTWVVQNPASQRTSDHLVCYRLIRQIRLARSF
jgi:hypothetical protein